MATSKGTRIGIWIIAITMTVGTLGSFAVMVLANGNQQADASRLQQLMTEFQNEQTAQSDELAAKYYKTFSTYADTPSIFNADSVSKLEIKDLVVGSGEVIKDDTQYSAYYIGWNPKGKVFDQSIEGDTLKAPIEGGNLIEGWNQGVKGMKIGGIRQLTIPAAQAYGEKGSGEDIPANTPIKFIVMAIPHVSAVQPSEELVKIYGQQQQQQ
ncbi:MAG: FKBP-type peptidyl-prolyl cis-trans isomerase [Candidatus Saccharimonadales bacterium]